MGFSVGQRVLVVVHQAFFYRLMAVVLVAGRICAMDAAAEAGPVTFRFLAVVGPPNTVSPFDVPFDMPFTFREGDVISAEFTIDPVDVPQSVLTTTEIQAHNHSFVVNTQILHTAVYSATVRNDQLSDDGPKFPYDELRLSCGPFAGNNPTCKPNTIPDAENILWGFDLGLLGDSSVLDGADIPGDPAAWNAFGTWRSLSMSFRELDGPGIRRLTATIGSFDIVPEPSNSALPFIVGISALLFRFKIRHRIDSVKPSRGTSRAIRAP